VKTTSLEALTVVHLELVLAIEEQKQGRCLEIAQRNEFVDEEK
jgi:hypothetical protein